MRPGKRDHTGLLKPYPIILFVGDPDRGRRLHDAIKSHGLNICIEKEEKALNNGPAVCMPDIVILDGFPESERARSAYYKYPYPDGVSFILLNDFPGAVKFSRLNAISFIRMIDRDPKPEVLIEAIADLMEAKSKLFSQPADRIMYQGDSNRCKLMNLRHINGSACC